MIKNLLKKVKTNLNASRTTKAGSRTPLATTPTPSTPRRHFSTDADMNLQAFKEILIKSYPVFANSSYVISEMVHPYLRHEADPPAIRTPNDGTPLTQEELGAVYSSTLNAPDFKLTHEISKIRQEVADKYQLEDTSHIEWLQDRKSGKIDDPDFKLLDNIYSHVVTMTLSGQCPKYLTPDYQGEKFGQEEVIEINKLANIIQFEYLLSSFKELHAGVDAGEIDKKEAELRSGEIQQDVFFYRRYDGIVQVLEERGVLWDGVSLSHPLNEFILSVERHRDDELFMLNSLNVETVTLKNMEESMAALLERKYETEEGAGVIERSLEAIRGLSFETDKEFLRESIELLKRLD